MRVLVTGGNGFIGRSLVEQLLARGDEVRVVGRNAYPELEQLGARCFTADLAAEAPLGEALQGVDTVFHVAAKAGIWGDLGDFYRNNVTATQHIVRSAIRADVPKFVLTSSPSVVFGNESVEGADESRPYPRHFLAPYPYTKALAEQWVLKQRDILTTAIRPPLVWGPRDPHIIPRIVERARAGRLPQIGDGTNRVDVTYVENAAEAHILAADRLSDTSPVRGRAYFIGQESPVYLWEFINTILERLDVPPIRRKIPYTLAAAAAAALETGYRLARSEHEPLLTRLTAAQLGKSRWFDLTAARRDLGYGPRITTAAGMDATIQAITERTI